MLVVEGVTRIPVLRPLITYDKQDIINIAKEIECYDISIRPFNDCCSIYVPRNPVTKPMDLYARKYEKTFDYEPLVEKAVQDVITLDINETFDFDIASFGFSVKEAYQNYLSQRDDDIDDHIETK
jgi:thiamine biosynthesis protein ThiI